MHSRHQHVLYIRGSQHGGQRPLRRHDRWNAGNWFAPAGVMVPVLLRQHFRPHEAEVPLVSVIRTVTVMHTHDVAGLIVHEPTCGDRLLIVFMH